MAFELRMMSFGSRDIILIVLVTMTLYCLNTTEKPRKRSLVLSLKMSLKMQDAEEAEIQFESEEGGTVKAVRFVDEMDRISAVGRESVSQMTTNTAQDLNRSMQVNRRVPPQRLIKSFCRATRSGHTAKLSLTTARDGQSRT
jgi:hypothetical protein